MDIFKFHNPTSPTRMEYGEIINGIKSKMWIERYRAGGEFKLVANADTDVQSKLPVGTFISHTDSTEVMIVENIEISDQKNKPKEVIISGRGFETFFEQRIVGSNKAFPTSTGVVDYSLASDETWDQAVALISDHILAASLLDDDNAIPYVSVLTDVVGAGTAVARSLKRGDLYKAVLDLLSVDNLGIKIVRPGPWSPLGGASPNLAIVIHRGVDKSNQIIFSYDTGEIERADYLWSNKKLKNAALVSGKWVETWVDTADIEYARRVMFVNASDIDNSYTTAPAGGALTAVIASMQQRGLAALAAQNDVALTKAEVNKENVRSKYRTDFDTGDVITVTGDYNASSQMRISEYVEIEDGSGNSRYPTLELV